MGESPRTVLMSIRAPYADAILSGLKTAEFRLRAPNPGVDILIYRSGGDRKNRGVVGVFTAGDVVSGTAVDHFREVHRPGIGLTDLENYAGGTAELVWRIDVTKPLPFARPVPLSVMGLARPPQSWQYVTTDQHGRVYLDLGVTVTKFDGPDS